jgi:hypothetical protein
LDRITEEAAKLGVKVNVKPSSRGSGVIIVRPGKR